MYGCFLWLCCTCVLSLDVQLNSDVFRWTSNTNLKVKMPTLMQVSKCGDENLNRMLTKSTTNSFQYLINSVAASSIRSLLQVTAMTPALRITWSFSKGITLPLAHRHTYSHPVLRHCTRVPISITPAAALYFVAGMGCPTLASAQHVVPRGMTLLENLSGR